MLCNDKCPRGLKCRPLSNVVSEGAESFVCMGLHGEIKEDYPQDKFRHCFVSGANNDSMFDYDEYDIKSVMSVMTEALLVDYIEEENKKG